MFLNTWIGVVMPKSNVTMVRQLMGQLAAAIGDTALATRLQRQADRRLP